VSARLACPACGSDDLTLHLFTLTSRSLRTGGETVEHDGPDSFSALACESCRTVLANREGDTRLRRAALYTFNDEPLDADEATYAAWFEVAERAVEVCEPVRCATCHDRYTAQVDIPCPACGVSALDMIKANQ
jgi:formate-dependent nitrite reductase cytochrome c552 subunit